MANKKNIFKGSQNGISFYESKQGNKKRLVFRQNGRFVSKEKVSEKLDININLLPQLQELVVNRGFNASDSVELVDRYTTALYTFPELLDLIKGIPFIFLNGVKMERKFFIQDLHQFETKVAQSVIYVKYKTRVNNKGKLAVTIPKYEHIEKKINSSVSSYIDRYGNFYLIKSENPKKAEKPKKTKK